VCIGVCVGERESHTSMFVCVRERGSYMYTYNYGTYMCVHPPTHTQHTATEAFIQVCIRKRALYIRKRALYIRQRALYIRKRYLHIRERALYIRKRERGQGITSFCASHRLHMRKRDLHNRETTVYIRRRALYIPSLLIWQDHHYFCARVVECVCAKETYISAKQQITSAKEHYTFHLY